MSKGAGWSERLVLSLHLKLESRQPMDAVRTIANPAHLSTKVSPPPPKKENIQITVTMTMVILIRL